jgi:hypothetical protein
VSNPGVLPETGAQTRVVNLYSENGEPVDVDVYGYTYSVSEMNEVGVLVATVPYGQTSNWFSPGVVQSPFNEDPYTRVDLFRAGSRDDLLVGTGEYLGPDTVATIAVWQEEVFEGEPDAWIEVIYAEHPEYDIAEAPAGQGLLLGRDVGLRAEGEAPFLYASVGDGCLESSIGRSDPEFPNVQPFNNNLALPVGEQTLTLHEEDKPGEIPTCKSKAVGPGAPISVAAGNRLISFPHRLPGEKDIDLLVLPFGLQ